MSEQATPPSSDSGHGALTMPEYDLRFEGSRRIVNAKMGMGTPRGEVDGGIDSVTTGPGQGWVKFTGISDTLLITGTAPVTPRAVAQSPFRARP